MTTANIPFELDAAHRRCIVGGEPMILHCHHYNTYLQQTILVDAEYIDSRPFMVGAAAEMAQGQLTRLFEQEGLKTPDERKSFAEDLYRWAGFGTLDFSTLNENGGTTKTKNSHYAIGWKIKWKESQTPVCHFTSGWLAGAMAAIYNKPAGTYSVKHEQCLAMPGHDTCVFEIKDDGANYNVYTSVGVGELSDHTVRPVPSNNVDYDGILNAVSSLPLEGGEEDGLIRAFGVLLTRHYANYYNRISFEFLRALIDKFGSEGREVAEPLLIEAGRICAFHTYGGIMTSTEWDGLIKPSLQTKEDWAHGMLAVVNALGWGRAQLTRLSAEEAEFVIHDDYESVGYLGMYGKADYPVSYLARGGAEGLMTLVYMSDIASKPDLTAEFYQKTFRSEKRYIAETTTSKAMGDEVTTFVVRLQ